MAWEWGVLVCLRAGREASDGNSEGGGRIAAVLVGVNASINFTMLVRFHDYLFDAPDIR